MKTIYKKLKDYISKDTYATTSIFGTLTDRSCRFVYEDLKGNSKTYRPTTPTAYNGEMDFLLNQYVVAVFPQWEIDTNGDIKAYLQVVLSRKKPE